METQRHCHLISPTCGLSQTLPSANLPELTDITRAPDIYLEAARKLDVEPTLCIALEDSNSGALSAISAGMKTIVIPDLLELTDEVISLSLDVVPSLAEVKHIIECLMKASGHSTVRS